MEKIVVVLDLCQNQRHRSLADLTHLFGKFISFFGVSTTAVNCEKITSRDATHLVDIPNQRTGLVESKDHGLSVRIKLLDPEYTQITLDSEPLIISI